VYYPGPVLFVNVISMDAARLPRILGAIIYDLIIVFAIIFVAAQWFPLVPEYLQTAPAMILFKQLYMLGISYLYFAYSWRRGGQTIGMKSWRVKLLQDEYRKMDGQKKPVSWRQCTIRYLVAIISWLVFGLGFIWIIFSPQHKSWHDMASGTRLVVIPKA
jgi:uncharacterized RDD family membrane protein YckC